MRYPCKKKSGAAIFAGRSTSFHNGTHKEYGFLFNYFSVRTVVSVGKDFHPQYHPQKKKKQSI